MKIHRSTTPDTAIQLKVQEYQETNADFEIGKHLDELFGSKNGDYFITSSQIRTDGRGRRFKILLVEDKDRDKHTLFFQLIKL